MKTLVAMFFCGAIILSSFVIPIWLDSTHGGYWVSGVWGALCVQIGWSEFYSVEKRGR